jgi:hypothetical protein
MLAMVRFDDERVWGGAELLADPTRLERASFAFGAI